MTNEQHAKLRELAMAATPGPWQWFGNTKMNEVYLATVDRGRRYVMDFVRWGMAGAQPRFQVLIDGKEENGGYMRSLAELAQGDVNAAGRLPIIGPKYEASHRKQFTGIGHADAEWIAAANPTAVISLLDEIEKLRKLLVEACDLAKSAITSIDISHDEGLASNAHGAEERIAAIRAEAGEE